MVGGSPGSFYFLYTYYSTSRGTSELVLDGITYHRVDTRYIPLAYAEVPVTLDDNRNGVTLPVCLELLSLTVAYTKIKVEDVCGSNWDMCE